MAAQVSFVYECPKCLEPLKSKERPKFCPLCKYDFGESGDHYKLPTTLSEQYDRLQNHPVYYQTILNLPMEKANSIVNDALHIIQTIAAKNVPVSDIRYVVEMSIKIGQIAKKYQKYLEAGGKHVPSLFIKETQDGKTGSGEKSS